MLDQAEKLRRLVTRSARANPRERREPRLLVVSGGKPGVGATTVAINLAVTLASDALRVILVDADFDRASIAAQCGVSDSIGISEVLAGRKSVHEAIQRGPAGLQVVAGIRASESRGSLPDRISQRVLRQFQSLGPHADWVVVDAGHESHNLAGELWAAAEQVLLVTSPDAAAVMDSYSLVKRLLSRQTLSRPVGLVVNHAVDEASAADVHRRIDQSCRRFLGLSPEFAAALPLDSAAARITRETGPLALQLPESSLAIAIQQLADGLVQRQSFSARQRMAA